MVRAMNNTTTTPRLKTDQPDVVREITVADAKALPGLLGRIAAAMLEHTGSYTYLEADTDTLIRLVRKS